MPWTAYWALFRWARNVPCHRGKSYLHAAALVDVIRSLELPSLLAFVLRSDEAQCEKLLRVVPKQFMRGAIERVREVSVQNVALSKSKKGMRARFRASAPGATV